MNIAYCLRIIQRPRHLDDVIHITRDGLIRCKQRSDILHSCAHGIQLEIYLALPGKTYSSLGLPNFLAILFHQEIIDANAVQTAAGRKLQTVKRLFEDAATKTGKLKLNLWIHLIAMNHTFEISQAGHIDIGVNITQQREVKMTAIKGQIQLCSLPHIANGTFQPQTAMIGHSYTQIINEQVIIGQIERCAGTFYLDALITDILRFGAAIQLQGA